MKIYSTYLYISLSTAALWPSLGRAEVALPVWLQPTWIQAKLTDFHAKNTERLAVAQANANNIQVSTNNGTANPNVAQSSVTRSNVVQAPLKQTVRLAPVETAVPKLNEKHLTPEELVELRRQLRQQR